jgi:hypothetical protein
MAHIVYVLSCGHQAPAFSADAVQRKQPDESHGCLRRSCRNTDTTVTRVRVAQ